MTQAQRTKLLHAAMKVAAVNSSLKMNMNNEYERFLQRYLRDALVMLDELVQEPVT